MSPADTRRADPRLPLFLVELTLPRLRLRTQGPVGPPSAGRQNVAFSGCRLHMLVTLIFTRIRQDSSLPFYG